MSMRNKLMKRVSLMAALMLCSVMAHAVSQPGQPTEGYGSTENYIASSAKERRTGPWWNPWGGVWCWYYEPNVLKGGNKAPVIVLLHGFAFLAPDIYDDTIDHFTRQGYIVLYPQINKGGILGIASDTDQNAMAARAVDSVNDALNRLGSKADRDNVYIFGHSLGGLIGAVWQADPDAAPIKGMVLANPQTNSDQGLPSFVQSFVNITPIDWRPKVKQVDVPTLILTGAQDQLAYPEQAIDLANEMTGVPYVHVYQAQTDTTGSPIMNADHLAAINNSGFLPDFVMELLGGAADTDAIDYRFYWATMDALIDGQEFVDYDMGTWSNGQPVIPIELLQ